MNPIIEVREITDEEVKQLKQRYNPRGVNLGGTHSVSAAITEVNMNDLIDGIRKFGGRKFLLTWEGSKIPRGAHVLDHEIGLTRYGRVLTTSGKTTGTYDRLVEFGGAVRKQQKMLIYLYPTKSA